MSIDAVLIVVAGILLVAGLAGTVVPVLPGVPLAWGGLLCAFFSVYCAIPVWMLAVTAAAAVAVTVLDTILPVTMTKKAGGSSWGTWGSTIGLIAGFFGGPLGILVCPFLGALVGELAHDSSDVKKSLHAALGAFKGFLFGTGIKIAAAGIFIWIFVWYLLKTLKG